MRKLINKIFSRIMKCLSNIYIPLNRLYCFIHGVRMGKGFKVKGLLFIRNNGCIQIGDKVRINSAGWANPIGCGDRTYIQVFSGGKFMIGNGCAISNCAFTVANEIKIEDNVMIGAGCKLYDTDFHPIDPYERINGINERISNRPILIKKGVY